LISRKEQAERLLNNPDFKELILDFYCKEECIRYLKLSLSEDMLNAEARDDSLAMAEDAAKVSIFMSKTVMLGSMAERDLPEAKKALIELNQQTEGE
jgi:hypothetical protein